LRGVDGKWGMLTGGREKEKFGFHLKTSHFVPSSGQVIN
jgi:hypothetical protein